MPLGRLLVTPAARRVLDESKESAWRYLFAHGSASWVTEEDRDQFEQAVKNDHEIVSFHILANGARIAVRTNQGHTETVIMLEDELS
jgi:hypothetical protein